MIETIYLIVLVILGPILIFVLFYRLFHDASSVIWKIDPIVKLLRKLDREWEGEYQRFKKSDDYDLILGYCRKYGVDWKNDIALSNLFGLISKKGYSVRSHDILYLIKQEIKLDNYHRQEAIKGEGVAGKEPGKRGFNYFNMMKKDEKP